MELSFAHVTWEETGGPSFFFFCLVSPASVANAD